MKTKLLVLVLVVAFALTAGVILAQRGGGGMGAGSGKSCGMGIGLGLGPAAVKELNLTSDQVTKLQAIRDKFIVDTQASRDDLQTRLKELAQLWTADNPDESAIRNKIAEIDSIRAQIRNAMVDRTFAVMSILTSDQKAKLRDLVKTRPGFGAGMGMGLGLGCDFNSAGCMLGGQGGGKGYRGGNK